MKMDNNSFEFNWTGAVQGDLEYIVRKTTSPVTMLTMPRYLLCGIAIALACTSVLFNYSVITALVRVQFSNLRAKYFIQNSAVANVLIPISMAVDIPLLLSALRIVDSNINLCCWATYFGLVHFCVFAQVGCAICLTCDRIYALAAPMLYYRVGYKPCLKILFLVAPWAVSLGILLIFLFLSIASTPALSECVTCELLYDAIELMWASGFLHIYIIGVNGLSFLIFIGIFVGLKYRRSEIQESPDPKLRGESLSLTVSFFLVITSTLCVYIPSQIFDWLEDWQSLSADEYDISFTLLRYIETLNVCNCIITPFLLFRIRSIQQNLPFHIPACRCEKIESMLIQNVHSQKNGDNNHPEKVMS